MTLLAGLVVVYAVLLMGLSWMSVRPIRIPIYLSPGGMGLPQEEIEFFARDGVPLRGWWVSCEGAQTVAVFSHGYLMNRCELVPEAQFLWTYGVASLLIDERVHGRSGGRRCTLGVREADDVSAAVAFAKQRMPGARVVLIGSSMGSAASLMALAEDAHLADGLVLDSCYSRLSWAIFGWWRFLGGKALSWALAPTCVLAWPFTRVNPFRVDLAKTIGLIEGVPILFLHGRNDNLALPSEAERNFRAAHEPKSIVWFEGCGHSEGRWLQSEKYRGALTGFLKEHGFVG